MPIKISNCQIINNGVGIYNAANADIEMEGTILEKNGIGYFEGDKLELDVIQYLAGHRLPDNIASLFKANTPPDKAKEVVAELVVEMKRNKSTPDITNIIDKHGFHKWLATGANFTTIAETVLSFAQNFS